MIYPLDDPLYSKYIKPIVDTFNTYYFVEEVAIHIDSVSTKGYVYLMIDALYDNKKFRSRLATLTVTDNLEVVGACVKAGPCQASSIISDMEEIMPNIKINYFYVWNGIKTR